MTRAESKLLIGIPVAALLLTAGLWIIFFSDDPIGIGEQRAIPNKIIPEPNHDINQVDQSTERSTSNDLEQLTPISAMIDRLVHVPDIDTTREQYHALLIKKYMIRSELNKAWERPVIGRLQNIGIRDFESELEVWLTYHDIECRLNKANKSSKAIKNEYQKGRKKTYWIKEILSFVYNPDRMILNRIEGYKKRKREISDNFLAYDALLADLESAVDEYNRGKKNTPSETATVDPISQQELSTAVNGAAIKYEAIYKIWPWPSLIEALIVLRGRTGRISINDGAMPVSKRMRHLMEELERHEKKLSSLLRSIQYECRYIHPDHLEAMLDESLDRYAYLTETSCIEILEKLLLACVLDGVLVNIINDQEKTDEMEQLSDEMYEQFLIALREAVEELISWIAEKAHPAEPMLSSNNIEAMMNALWPKYRTLLEMAVEAGPGDKDFMQSLDAFNGRYTKVVRTIVEHKKNRTRYEYFKAKMMSCISFLISEMVWEDRSYFKTVEQVSDGPIRKRTTSDWEDELLAKLARKDDENLLDRIERKGIVKALRPKLQKYHIELTDEAAAELRREYSRLVGERIEKKYRSREE